jgi:pSer/pThr/pTyr-binding forkhead associated (FHA) protein
MTRIELIGQNGLTGSRKFIVEKFPVTIGTSRDAGVQLTDPDVLPLHCEIEVHDGEIFVRDLSGKGLTYVNDTPVKEGRIEPGSRLRVGQSSFIVRLWEPPEPVASYRVMASQPVAA